MCLWVTFTQALQPRSQMFQLHRADGAGRRPLRKMMDAFNLKWHPGRKSPTENLMRDRAKRTVTMAHVFNLQARMHHTIEYLNLQGKIVG